MAKKTPPRTKKQIKAAMSASKASGIEVSASNCSISDSLDAVVDYNIYGYGKSGQTYVVGSVHDFASVADQAKQTTGKDANGAQANIQDSAELIKRVQDNNLSSSSARFYFDTVGTGLTGTVSPVSFIYGKSGPQAPYIPQLVHGTSSAVSHHEFVFFLPSSITGALGANMPTDHSRSFEVTIAGAVAPGESIQVFTQSSGGVRVATGSAFTFSASYCTSPNFTHQTMHIPTSSLDGIGAGGITIIYDSTYATGSDNKSVAPGAQHKTPYAGAVITIMPSSIEGS